MSIVDFYASNYGWNRDDILNNTYLDEYFILKDRIHDRKKNEQREKYLMQAYISLLPHMKEKARKEFFDRFFEDEQIDSFVTNKEPIKTDFEAIERAKIKLQYM